MNVLFLINYAGNGGSERYVESLISRLHPTSVRCALCCNIKGRLSERLKKAGLNVKTIEQLRDEAYAVVGKPDELAFGGKVVAVVTDPEGRALDVIYNVKA